MIAQTGFSLINPDCTPGYYNSYGRPVAPQDRTYDGGFPKYFDYMTETRAGPGKYFDIR